MIASLANLSALISETSACMSCTRCWKHSMSNAARSLAENASLKSGQRLLLC